MSKTVNRFDRMRAFNEAWLAHRTHPRPVLPRPYLPEAPFSRYAALLAAAHMHSPDDAERVAIFAGPDGAGRKTAIRALSRKLGRTLIEAEGEMGLTLSPAQIQGLKMALERQLAPIVLHLSALGYETYRIDEAPSHEQYVRTKALLDLIEIVRRSPLPHLLIISVFDLASVSSAFLDRVPCRFSVSVMPEAVRRSLLAQLLHDVEPATGEELERLTFLTDLLSLGDIQTQVARLRKAAKARGRALDIGDLRAGLGPFADYYDPQKGPESANPDLLRRICLHEAGHVAAILATLGPDQLRGVLVNRAGQFHGLTLSSFWSLPPSATLPLLLSVFSASGRAAEERFYGEATLGSAVDSCTRGAQILSKISQALSSNLVAGDLPAQIYAATLPTIVAEAYVTFERRAYNFAVDIVEANAAAITIFAERLAIEYELSGTRLSEAIARARFVDVNGLPITADEHARHDELGIMDSTPIPEEGVLYEKIADEASERIRADRAITVPASPTEQALDLLREALSADPGVEVALAAGPRLTGWTVPRAPLFIWLKRAEGSEKFNGDILRDRVSSCIGLYTYFQDLSGYESGRLLRAELAGARFLVGDTTALDADARTACAPCTPAQYLSLQIENHLRQAAGDLREVEGLELELRASAARVQAQASVGPRAKQMRRLCYHMGEALEHYALAVSDRVIGRPVYGEESALARLSVLLGLTSSRFAGSWVDYRADGPFEPVADLACLDEFHAYVEAIQAWLSQPVSSATLDANGPEKAKLSIAGTLPTDYYRPAKDSLDSLVNPFIDELLVDLAEAGVPVSVSRHLSGPERVTNIDLGGRASLRFRVEIIDFGSFKYRLETPAGLVAIKDEHVTQYKGFDASKMFASQFEILRAALSRVLGVLIGEPLAAGPSVLIDQARESEPRPGL